ncbi:MAG TPA: cation:proton antiporter [Methanocorpusculum sp.]|nr:cation:proton antiporter [Methanocorpusculum sp.]
MDEAELIFSVLVVLVCAIVVLLVGRKLRMPIIIGYFITGIIIGPYGFGLITLDQVNLLADLGVILLMFTIGLEISVKNLLAMKKIVLIGGTLQLVLTTAAVCGLMMAFGFTFSVSLFIGFLVAHSSTAIILNIYQRSGEVDKQHGKIALGLLIFQDLNVIPMMLAVPFLAGTGNEDIVGSIVSLVVGLVILGIILVAAVYLVPKILRHVALTRSGELFVIAIVVICFGIAWLMSMNGVSLALGAFLAGVAISGSDYNHEILGQITPIRDILTSFFFVSIGMMLNLNFVWDHIPIILGLAAALLAFKTLINFISVKAIGVATGAAILSAVGLSQIGEFSFILGSTGVNAGILSPDIYQIFLAISIVTMAATPFLVALIPKIVNKYVKPKVPAPADTDEMKKDHEIIVGFGLAGRYVARALERMKIDYVVLETNAATVSAEHAKGVPIFFGDASREAVLGYAGIRNAASIVISIPQMDTVKTIISGARRMNPQINIITRSRFISETSDLYKIGADSVIVDERESAVQMFKRILASKQMPVQDIEQFSKEIRSELYDKYVDLPVTPQKSTSVGHTKLLDSLFVRAKQADDALSREMSHVSQIRVENGCSVCGKCLSDIHLRRDFGVSVIAIKHAGEKGTEVSPAGTTSLTAGDTVVVIGDRKGITKMLPLFMAEQKSE